MYQNKNPYKSNNFYHKKTILDSSNRYSRRKIWVDKDVLQLNGYKIYRVKLMTLIEWILMAY